MRDTRVRFEDDGLQYKKMFKWHSLPYGDIAQAYLRIEESRSRMCCAVASFFSYFLMLKTKDDELLKIEVSRENLVNEMLAEIKAKNPDVEIGLHKVKVVAAQQCAVV